MGIFSPPQPQMIAIPSPKAPAPSTVLTPQSPIEGAKPKRTSATPSFLGSAATPGASQANSGGKTLLGQ